ncbi:MAG: insulinase family protein [Oscillospiraceae bacterium]|nr:insulinase family protein [Oscillospiraceae bacterium]
MQKKTYSRLDLTVFSDTLSNGLRLYVIPKRGFSKKYAFFATNYGSLDTSFSVGGRKIRSADGIAHYLEHKMFDTEDGHALQAMSATGASPNAFTSYSITAYHFESTDSFAENLRLLLSFVSVPYFTDETVEKERGIISQEIRMYEDSPGSRLGENLYRAMYRNHPLRVNIAGTVDSIQQIDPQMLYTCHHAFYDPSNMVLCVAADVDPEMIRTIAEEILPPSSGQIPERDYGEPEPSRPDRPRIEQNMEVSMPMFALAFKCPEIPEGQERLRQELLGDLASEILCGDSSPLYQKLYEQGLIDSGFGVGYECIKGMPNVSFAGDSDEPETVMEEILREAERISREGVDPALFDRVRRASLGQRIRGLDSFDGVCYRLTGSYFDGSDYFLFPECYDTITPEDVRLFIAEHIVSEQAVLSLILPVQQEA